MGRKYQGERPFSIPSLLYSTSSVAHACFLLLLYITAILQCNAAREIIHFMGKTLELEVVTLDIFVRGITKDY